MSFCWKTFYSAFLGKILAGIFIAICVALGFGPDEWAKTMITNLPEWITPPVAQLVFVLLALITSIFLYISIRTGKLKTEPKAKKVTYAREASYDMQREIHQAREAGNFPDMKMSDAIDYVRSILSPDSDPNVLDYQTEMPKVTDKITEKIKSGEVNTWGKRVEITQEYGARELRVHIDQEQFNQDDWKHREMLPLEASIPTEKKPQTRSVGRSDDHVQFTALKVNEKQIRQAWTDTAISNNSFNSLQTGKHDVWLVEAVHYTVFRNWNAREVSLSDSKELDELYQNQKQIRQLASDGDLPIWGMNNFSGPLVLIGTDYWQRYDFEFMGALQHTEHPDEWKTENARPPNDLSIYHSLKTSKEVIEKYFPTDQKLFEQAFNDTMDNK
jgi:hypothetical protein